MKIPKKNNNNFFFAIDATYYEFQICWPPGMLLVFFLEFKKTEYCRTHKAEKTPDNLDNGKFMRKIQ